MRDSGPICVKNAAGDVAFNHFVFNGWAKYANHKKDAAAVTNANKKLKRDVWNPVHTPCSAGRLVLSPAALSAPSRRVVLEGGSIDVNGQGTLLTTEECLLSKTQERNPGFTKEDYAESSKII